MDFQNEAASLCVNNSTNKDSELLWYDNLIQSLFNQSRIFKTEAMEAVLRLVKHVYLFDSPGSVELSRINADHCCL